LLTEIGLERTDNNMDLTSWPAIAAINQKNYYTEYLKRDDQILAYRLQQEENRNRMTKQAKDRDRALAQGRPVGPEGDVEMDEDQDELQDEVSKGTKTIVIHFGSQNLRIGLASDALPKTVPMVIAKKAIRSESEEGCGEPKPKRVKLDDGSDPEPEKQFGDEVSCYEASRWICLTRTVREPIQRHEQRTQNPDANEQAKGVTTVERYGTQLQQAKSTRDHLRT
jgi:actin-related protein 8